MRKLDLVGVTFGRLTVYAAAQRTYQTMWACRCCCGNTPTVSGINLTTGHTQSCGCLREELRSTYAKKRDFNGSKNPRAKTSLALNGENYIASSSVWYKRAAGVYYLARKNNVKLGFRSVMELATYVVSIAPDKCPVFNKDFSERGVGFSNWSPSIDKIDPKRGYVKGNIQIISMLANCMKRNASPKELRTFAQWVLKDTK
jgi:hypothetical protein